MINCYDRLGSRSRAEHAVPEKLAAACQLRKAAASTDHAAKTPWSPLPANSQPSAHGDRRRRVLFRLRLAFTETGEVRRVEAKVTLDGPTSQVKLFLCYRREDTKYAARGIYERLCEKYGSGNVFRDLDTIPAGVRFREFIEERLSSTDIFILLIGTTWISAQDGAKRRRIEQPRDSVRVEIETALRLRLPVIPVLVDNARMPTEEDLPPSLVDLCEFNAAEVSDSRWDYDTSRLLLAVDQVVEARTARLEMAKRSLVR